MRELFGLRCMLSPAPPLNGQISPARKNSFRKPFQSHHPCLPLLQKYSYFFFSEIMIISSRPALDRGAFRDRHERGAWDAVDVSGLQRAINAGGRTT
jgi:hypothetical protein